MNHNIVEATLSFIEQYRQWGAPIVFLLAFCESFAFVSLAVPATAILLGVGALIAAVGLDYWVIWLSAVLGAIFGDWLAYDLALRFRESVLSIWPFPNHPELVARGIKLFHDWGMLAVFGGRFFGPFRAIVPIAAGLNTMPWLRFQLANAASALLWATGILTPGFLGMRWFFG